MNPGANPGTDPRVVPEVGALPQNSSIEPSPIPVRFGQCPRQAHHQLTEEVEQCCHQAVPCHCRILQSPCGVQEVHVSRTLRLQLQTSNCVRDFPEQKSKHVPEDQCPAPTNWKNCGKSLEMSSCKTAFSSCGQTLQPLAFVART